MNPSWRVTATLKSDSLLNPLEEISQEVASTSQPSFSEEKTPNRMNSNTSPDSNYRIAKPEGLLQQQFRDEMTQQEGQGGKSAFPNMKNTSMEDMRQKTYQVQRKMKIPPSYIKYQRKCQCHYCQIQRQGISSNAEEQNPPSWKALVEGFTNLNFKTETKQVYRPPDEQPQDLEKEKKPQEEKKSKRIPQRKLK